MHSADSGPALASLPTEYSAPQQDLSTHQHSPLEVSLRMNVASRRLRLKTYVLIFLMMIFGTAGNAMLDKGMKRIGSLDLSTYENVRSATASILSSGAIWIGIACLLLYMVSHMLVLSWADYSFVMPFTAISYALVPLAGYIWLGEPVGLTRWMGIALIVCGVFLVSRTQPSTTRSTDGAL
jgi:undecaprenyl phosphate-alpha-L-ara4N flippase subunit ArnE